MAVQKNSYHQTAEAVKDVKNFNKDLRYTQGFRQAVGAGATVPIDVKLKSPGRQLLGFAFIPTTASDITDCQGSVSVNNMNLCVGTALQNFNPGFVHSMVFFPTPQPLSGNDTITFSITNNGGTDILGTLVAFYVPQAPAA